jgi:hypothetical protein
MEHRHSIGLCEPDLSNFFWFYDPDKACCYEPSESKGIFSDVDMEEWYARWVGAAYQAGTELRYCLENPHTRAVAVYMMVQTKGLTP